MTLTEVIHARRSIRRYKPAEITHAQIDALLEAAILASGGTQIIYYAKLCPFYVITVFCYFF